MNSAYIIFEIAGIRYEYDGGFPEQLEDLVESHLNADGFWRDRPDLSAQCKDLGDGLPDVLWEIEQLGGKVISIHGARENGSIHWEDWKSPRVI